MRQIHAVARFTGSLLPASDDRMNVCEEQLMMMLRRWATHTRCIVPGT